MGYKDKEEQRKFQREWKMARKAEFYEGKSCVRCDSTEQLELDHIDRGKKVSHNIWSWSQAKRDAEIAKCQVLCHDCHWQKTRDDMGWRQEHGTLTSYSKYGCRCDACRNANAEKARKYRARVVQGPETVSTGAKAARGNPRSTERYRAGPRG